MNDANRNDDQATGLLDHPYDDITTAIDNFNVSDEELQADFAVIGRAWERTINVSDRLTVVASFESLWEFTEWATARADALAEKLWEQHNMDQEF